MSELATTVADSELSTADLLTLLETLDGQQAVISLRRRLLHGQIDELRQENGDSAELAALQNEERELSSTRLELHQRINELRMERGRRVAGLRANLHAVS